MERERERASEGARDGVGHLIRGNMKKNILHNSNIINKMSVICLRNVMGYLKVMLDMIRC